MGDKELNELSLNELEQVSGGGNWTGNWTRQLHCEVRGFPCPGYDHYAIVKGNIPLGVCALISVPAFNFIGTVEEVRPGASEWDNAIAIYFPENSGVKWGIRNTDVFVLFDVPYDHV